MTHDFLFQPGTWLGEGKMRLSVVAEKMDFFCRWTVNCMDQHHTISATQEIELKGMNDSMFNQFLLTGVHNGHFDIELENQPMGRVEGTGLITDKTIAWEFRLIDLGLEGMEFYERTEDGYQMRAEYSTTDDYRTTINGRIWRAHQEVK